eukprot:gene8722-11188_t
MGVREIQTRSGKHRRRSVKGNQALDSGEIDPYRNNDNHNGNRNRTNNENNLSARNGSGGVSSPSAHRTEGGSRVRGVGQLRDLVISTQAPPSIDSYGYTNASGRGGGENRRDSYTRMREHNDSPHPRRVSLSPSARRRSSLVGNNTPSRSRRSSLFVEIQRQWSMTNSSAGNSVALSSAPSASMPIWGNEEPSPSRSGFSFVSEPSGSRLAAMLGVGEDGVSEVEAQVQLRKNSEVELQGQLCMTQDADFSNSRSNHNSNRVSDRVGAVEMKWRGEGTREMEREERSTRRVSMKDMSIVLDDRDHDSNRTANGDFSANQNDAVRPVRRIREVPLESGVSVRSTESARDASLDRYIQLAMESNGMTGDSYGYGGYGEDGGGVGGEVDDTNNTNHTHAVYVNDRGGAAVEADGKREEDEDEAAA